MIFYPTKDSDVFVNGERLSIHDIYYFELVSELNSEQIFLGAMQMQTYNARVVLYLKHGMYLSFFVNYYHDSVLVEHTEPTIVIVFVNNS